MRATTLLLGCLLSLGAIANVAATGTAAASVNAGAGCTGHGSSDRSGGHDTSSSSNGDSVNVSRSNGSSSVPSSNAHAAGTANSTMDDSPAHLGGGDATPDGSSRGSSGLSWQSLLPGSIQ
ncbi:MAG TPA: hypothetical protein VL997_09575 [Dyella sp.]|nr:hypothetical protein [Dyella sp.]